MVQYRHIDGSSQDGLAKGGDGAGDIRIAMLRGVESFVAYQSRPKQFRELTLPHRLIRDTYTTAGINLLDFVYLWTRTPGFADACPTLEDLLVTIIAILEPTVLADAEQEWIHPVFQQVIARRATRTHQTATSNRP